MTSPLWDDPGATPAEDLYDCARIYYGRQGHPVPDPLVVYVAPHAVEKYREVLGPDPYTPDGKRIEVRTYDIVAGRESDPRMIIVVIVAVIFMLAGIVAWLIVAGIG
jgi:hypothetical protein